MKYRYLSIIILIIIYLVSFELVLEYRAKERGFWTFFFGKDQLNNLPDTSTSKSFNYRSPAIDVSKPVGSVRVWMASASYAEDTKRKVNELFPNILCDSITNSGQQCQMINASKAGFTINKNILQLKNNAKKWKPDYALLYSMNLDINNLANQYLGLQTNTSSSQLNDSVDDSDKRLSINEYIEKSIEQMTIYGHLRRYLGGQVLLSAILFDDIGEKAIADFKQTLRRFIRASRDVNVNPVLITFATQYDIRSFNEMTHDETLFLVRYNEYLSSKGWAKTIHDFNEVIRQIANETNTPYIDLESKIGGNKKYFTDYVHFTKEGHKVIGVLLADGLLRIINRNLSEAP